MRVKKSIKNASIGILMYMLSFLPLFFLRKIFIQTLGVELLGLCSLYTNIVGYLSVAELGIGSAIIFSLYRPFAENDHIKIKGYLSYYKKFYQIIALFISIVGIFTTVFINLFIKNEINLTLVRIGFLLFLINTVIGYLFTYKHCLLNVAQEGYKVTASITFAKILIAIFQVIVLLKTENFYLYLIVQILVNLILYLIMNKYINQRFPWFENIQGKIEKSEIKKLVQNIKALFCHKIGGILVLGTDNIVISTFINLTTVAVYNNYALVTTAMQGILGNAMNGITASIGNLLVEKDKVAGYIVHQRLFFINFWIASFIVISLFNTLDSFIVLWVGEAFLLDRLTFAVILFNLYFMMMRGQVEQFKNASGEYYKDRYAPLLEGGINLVFSLVLVNLIGLPGVFLGTLISNLSVIFWIQPLIVYRYVFEQPLTIYFKRYISYFLIGIIPLVATYFLTSYFRENLTIANFILNCLINIVVINGFYLIIFRKNENMDYFKGIVRKILMKRKEE